MNYREVDHINSALSDQTDVSQAFVLRCNSGACYTGQYPHSDGFMLNAGEARAMLRACPRDRQVVWPFLTGNDLIVHGAPKRWVIDFQTKTVLEAQSYNAPFSRY